MRFSQYNIVNESFQVMRLINNVKFVIELISHSRKDCEHFPERSDQIIIIR